MYLHSGWMKKENKRKNKANIRCRDGYRIAFNYYSVSIRERERGKKNDKNSFLFYHGEIKYIC